MELDLRHMPVPPKSTAYRIGVVGAGFIVRDVQLIAYGGAGYDVRAIASRTPVQAARAAALRGIPVIYGSWQELLADRQIDVLDIAVPPHAQLEIVDYACRHARHLKGIL